MRWMILLEELLQMLKWVQVGCFLWRLKVETQKCATMFDGWSKRLLWLWYFCYSHLNFGLASSNFRTFPSVLFVVHYHIKVVKSKMANNTVTTFFFSFFFLFLPLRYNNSTIKKISWCWRRVTTCQILRRLAGDHILKNLV